MEKRLQYENLFQDKYIYKSVGRSSYYEETYPALVQRRNRKPTRFIKYVLNFYQRMRKPARKNGNVLFLEHKFERIARSLSDNYNIYILHDSINIYKEFTEIGFYQYFYRTWMKQVDKSFITYDMQYANKALVAAQKFLEKNKINVVFTGNDKMFMEKLVLAAAENANIPTVVIQHGIYTDEISFGKLKTADTANNFWAWSQYIKDCYLKRYGKSENCVKVIGYPFELLPEKNTESKAVLFLGNNYRKGDQKQWSSFIEIAKEVLTICNELRIPFFYRPHPGEIIDSAYGEIVEHVQKNNTLLEDLSKSKIIIGDLSSVMIEASLCGRNVIQIVWNELSEVASKDPMYSFTNKVSAEKEIIKTALVQCLNSKTNNQIDDYYMYKDPLFLENVHSYVDDLINN